MSAVEKVTPAFKMKVIEIHLDCKCVRTVGVQRWQGSVVGGVGVELPLRTFGNIVFVTTEVKFIP